MTGDRPSNIDDYIEELRRMGVPDRVLRSALESMYRELTRPSEPSSILVGREVYESLKAMFGVNDD